MHKHLFDLGRRLWASFGGGRIARTAAAMALIGMLSPGSAPAAKTLTVAVAGFPREMGHPYAVSNLPAIYTFTAIYDALTFVDETGALQPWLATAWRQTSDTTWVFTLRPNVKFSNGEPMNAAAVASAVAYLTSDEAKVDTSAQELSSIAGARVLDPLNVEITTKAPNPMLPREVSAFRIVAPEAWKRLGGAGYAKAPVGTGPFKVDNWSPSRIVLSAYRESWRPPKVDGLELLFLPEMSSRTQGIMSGRVDIATTMRVEDRALIESGGHRMVPRPGTGVFVIQFNMTKDPRFRDLRVRQALNYAVNRDGISEVMLGGLIKPASQFTPPNANGYDPTVSAWPYDPDKARALLKEAGYPNGFSFIFEGVLGGGVSDGALFQQIAADLAKVGVIMEIRPLLLTQLSINMHSDTGFIGSAFGTDYGTAPSLDSLRALKLHSCMHPFTWYCDRELQPTVDRALSARTMDERRTLTQAVMRRYREQMPALLLWDIVYFDAVRKEIGEAPAVGTWMIYDRVTKN